MRQISSKYQACPQAVPVLAQTGRAGVGAASFAAIGTVLQLGAKETLIWEGDAADHVYQIGRGVACLYKLLPDGRRQVARFCHAGDLIGLTADGYYPYTADALTGLSVVRIRRAELDSRIETDCAFRRSVLNAIGQELSLAQNQLLLLGRKSASERVASFLRAMVEQAVRDGGDGRSVVLAMTRVDIADFLGLTHETVCRTFSLFRNQGIIAIPDPHLVEILRPEVLEEIAEGDTPDRLCA
jgi:CRP/FNR family transcriptional regulator, anaerobic regulatory protein